MVDTLVNTFFVSEKISKIRWVPEELQASERFLTGTSEMPNNYLRLWRFRQNEYPDEYNECVPDCHDKLLLPSDVSGLEFVTKDMAALSCADGHIYLVKVKRAVEEDELDQEGRSPLLHQYQASGCAAPCTALSVYDREIATVGEDGRLNIIDTSVITEVKRTIEADSVSLMSVKYVNPQEVLTANRMGVIRLFDVRVVAEEAAVTAFMTTCQDENRTNYVSSLASHPTQQHIVLAGSEEGSISVWDLRQPGCPASYLSAHTSAITELAFHKTEPSKLFTAAENGELWMWAQHAAMAVSDLEVQTVDNVNPWLNGERAKSRIGVTSLITDIRKSMNTFDASDSKIICGSDSEAIYYIDNIF